MDLLPVFYPTLICIFVLFFISHYFLRFILGFIFYTLAESEVYIATALSVRPSVCPINVNNSQTA